MVGSAFISSPQEGEPETVEHWNQTWNCVGRKEERGYSRDFLQENNKTGSAASVKRNINLHSKGYYAAMRK